MDISVSPSQAQNMIVRAIHADRPTFLWGSPGIGKSDIVEQITNNVLPGNNLMIDCRLALMEPTDLRGYPFRNPDTNQMEWSPPVDLPSEEFASEYDLVILFLDELNSAPPSTQAAAYQLILNRRVGQYQLPQNVRIVCAGNHQTDRGVTYNMPSPLANRFAHINMDVNFDDFMVFAVNNGVHPDVIGYLNFAKSDLFDFDPKNAGKAWASPRSWVRGVSSMLYTPGFEQADIQEQKAEIAGAVGDGIAAKFVEHRRVAEFLPSVDDVLAGKVKKLDTKLNSEISAKYALVIGLAYSLNETFTSGDKKVFKSEFNNAIRFSYENFSPEQVILLFKTIMTTYKIRFNVRTDMEKDLYKIFSEKYTKYIV